MQKLFDMLGISSGIKALTTIIIVAVLVAMGVSAFLVLNENKKLKEDVQTSAATIESYRKDKEEVERINLQNQIEIKALQAYKDQSEQARSDLKLRISRDQQTIAALSTSINNTKPEENGPVAPVLKNTIDSIQKIRDGRVAK